MKMIVFDIDGTLFDTQEGIYDCFCHVLKSMKRSIPSKSDITCMIGPPVKKVFSEQFKFCDSEAEYATQLYRKNYVEKYLCNSRMYNGCLKTVQQICDKGDIVAIATMKTQKQVDALLECFGLTDFFAIIMAAKEDGSITKSDMLRMIKKEYSICDSFYMVGDTAGDLKASMENDYQFIYANYGYGIIETNKEIISINSLEEILNMYIER